jgi:hypothetical protein
MISCHIFILFGVPNQVNEVYEITGRFYSVNVEITSKDSNKYQKLKQRTYSYIFLLVKSSFGGIGVTLNDDLSYLCFVLCCEPSN